MSPSTVSCVTNCGQQISPNATHCPKCGTAQWPGRGTKGCRVCGKLLSYREHRYPVAHSIFHVENHKPCPQCGEPQPMWSPSDTFWKWVKTVALFTVLTFVFSAVLIVARGDLKYHPRYHGYYKSYYKRYGCGF